MYIPPISRSLTPVAEAYTRKNKLGSAYSSLSEHEVEEPVEIGLIEQVDLSQEKKEDNPDQQKDQKPAKKERSMEAKVHLDFSV